MTMKLRGQNQLSFLMFCQIKIQPGICLSNILKIKFLKNIELLFKAKPFLNKQSLLSLYYS